MSLTYFPVRLNTLRADEKVTFDVYVLVAGKYIHYTHTSDELEAQRLKQLKSKGVRKLFIRDQDEPSYLLYLEAGLGKLNDKTLDINTRSAMAHDTMITAAENAERTLETEAGYNSQKAQFEKITEFISSDRNAIKGILSAAGISVDTNQHAATVSSLCMAVASKAGITDSKDVFELAIAALLHDIGKNRFKFDPMKPHSKMTSDEMRQFKNHPQDGADMLAGKPYISPRILGLVAAHEERGNGRGFPMKMDLSKQPISYQILSMVNQFDHFCSENSMSSIQAIDPFFEKLGRDYDDELFNILATVLT